MQTLVRVVVALVIVLLLLLVALPLQLINVLAENDPEYDPENELQNRGRPADDLEVSLRRLPRLAPPPYPRPRKRRLEFGVRRLISANDMKALHFHPSRIGPLMRPIYSLMPLR